MQEHEKKAGEDQKMDGKNEKLEKIFREFCQDHVYGDEFYDTLPSADIEELFAELRAFLHAEVLRRRSRGDMERFVAEIRDEAEEELRESGEGEQ